MYQRDYRDIVGGGLLVLVGIIITWHTWSTIDLGTFRRMGPGTFPIAVGILIAFFGVTIMLPAFFRAGSIEGIRVRSGLAVAGGISLFALTIRPFGLLPAIIGLILVSTMAETKFRPLTIMLMCLILPLAAYIIFSVGLNLPLNMVRSPF